MSSSWIWRSGDHRLRTRCARHSSASGPSSRSRRRSSRMASPRLTASRSGSRATGPCARPARCPRRSASSTDASASGCRRTSSHASRPTRGSSARATSRPARSPGTSARRQSGEFSPSLGRSASGFFAHGRHRRRAPRLPDAARTCPPTSPPLVIVTSARRVLGREVAPRHPCDDGVPRDARRSRSSASGPRRCRSSTRRPAGPRCPSASTTPADRGPHRRRALGARWLRPPAREPAAREPRRRGADRGRARRSRRAGHLGPAVTPFVLAVPPRAKRAGARSRSTGAHRRQRAARRGGRGSVRCLVSLYDAVRDLPLLIDGYELEGLELQARPDFLRKTTVVHLQGGERGGDRRGRHLPRGGARAAAGPRARPAARRNVDAAHVLGAPRRAAALRAGARAARVPRLSPVGVRERRARPRAPAGRDLARRGSRPPRAAGRVRRLDGARGVAVDRARALLARALPRPPLQARREPGVDGRARGRARGHRRGRLDRLQGPVPRHRGRHTLRTRRSTGASPKGCRRPGSRTRRSPRRRSPCSSPIAIA